MNTAAEPVERGRRAAPPFRPDPDLVGNSEGNRRILRHDRAAAQRIVDDVDRAEAVAPDEPDLVWRERLRAVFSATLGVMASDEAGQRRQPDIVPAADDEGHWVVVLRSQRSGDIVVGQTFETQEDAEAAGRVLSISNPTDDPAEVFVQWQEAVSRAREEHPHHD